MFRSLCEKRRVRNRSRRKNHRKFVRAVRSVERDEISLIVLVSRKLEIQSAAYLVRCKTGSVAWFCRQKSCRGVIGARTDDVQITIIVRRKMELKRLAGLHVNGIAGPKSGIFIRSVAFNPITANFMS